MSNYFIDGWKGNLSFNQILFGHHGEDALLYFQQAGLPHIIICILGLVYIFLGEPLFKNISFFLLCLHAVVTYVWLVKAIWGSAKYFETKFDATAIKVLMPILPLLAFVIFIFAFMYHTLVFFLRLFFIYR